MKILELDYEEDMMYKTLHVLCLIPNPIDESISKLKDTIEHKLDKKFFEEISSKYSGKFAEDSLNWFTTSLLSSERINKLSSKVEIQNGADDEKEFACAFEICDKLVILLHSDERGSSIRMDQYIDDIETIGRIIDSLCSLYNTKI